MDFSPDELTEFEWDLNETYFYKKKDFDTILKSGFEYKNILASYLRSKHTTKGEKFAIFLIFQNDDVSQSVKIKFWNIRENTSFTQEIIKSIEIDADDQPLYLEII